MQPNTFNPQATPKFINYKGNETVTSSTLSDRAGVRLHDSCTLTTTVDFCLGAQPTALQRFLKYSVEIYKISVPMHQNSAGVQKKIYGLF